MYELMLFITAKNLQQGYFGEDDFNLSINHAQNSYASFLLGSLPQYTPGRPVARVELGSNQTVRQRLQPIIYGYNLSVDSDGFSSYPGDYLQTDAMWTIYGYKRIRFVQQDQLDSVYNSVIDPIATNPIYLIEDNGFRVHPNNLSQAKLSYVRNPPEIKWASTPDGNGIPVYDAANSKQPVWDVASILEIIARALQFVGLNMQFADVSRYANEIKAAGQ